jgi:hypothetical protein
MPTLSKVYPVKSNAARAAKGYGLDRNSLQAVDGGWAFYIPDNAVRTPQPKAAPRAKPAKPLKPAKAKSKAKPKAKSKAKANGKTKRKAGGKTGIVAEVIAELKARWTSANSILKKTGWVSNTFRGILGAYKRNTGGKFESKREDGVTYYRITA